MTGGNISLTKFPGDIVSGYLAHLVSDLFRITQSISLCFSCFFVANCFF